MSGKMWSEMRDRLRADALDTIYWPKRAPLVVEHELPVFYRAVADVVGAEEKILYLEFGVAHGKSMTEITSIYSHRDSRFFGFDSFVGLPEDWLMHKVGSFSNNGKPPVINDQRVEFIQGWFQNAVPRTIERIAKVPHDRVLVHIDSDLYSSALFLLAQLWNVFDDYYFMFDDFIYDECVAVADFLKAFPNKIEFMIQTRGGGDGPNPDQVFGRMRRTELRID
jgi:hypothetical protein